MTGTSDLKKAQAIAAQIEQKAKDALRPLECKMQIMGWKPEFRSIMWSAVAIEATRRAAEAEKG